MYNRIECCPYETQIIAYYSVCVEKWFHMMSHMTTTDKYTPTVLCKGQVYADSDMRWRMYIDSNMQWTNMHRPCIV